MRTRDDKIFNSVGHILMLLLSLMAIIPLILLVVSSLTDNDTLIRNGYSFFPEKWSIYAYEYILKTGNTVIRAYGISFVLTIIGTIFSLIITTMLAYMLSKKDLPYRRTLTFLVFFTMLFNGGLVPTYINYVNVFHIKNTFWALLFPNLLTRAYYILLMKSYFVTSVPDEILEAAYIDGAGQFTTFIKVALPLAKPIISTIGLFAGIGYWNDWMNGYIYLTKRTDLYSIQNLLNRMIRNIQFLSENVSAADTSAGVAAIPSVSIRMAIAVLGVLPIIVVYPFVQKYFVKGITLGGVKG